MKNDVMPIESIAGKILLIRNQKVMLDRDLAELYGVETRVLMQGVRRNINRFPSDFMFQLNNAEFENLKSQFVTSSWGGIRKLPHAFSEQGVAMLSSVLRSKRAVDVNIAIMRAFVRMRELLYADKELALRVEKIEKILDGHGKSLHRIIQEVSDLLKQPKPKSKRIGF